MGQILNLDGERRQRLADAKIERAFEITPSDSDELTHSTIAIYCGIGGDLKVELVSGDVITLTNLIAGAWHPIAAVKVLEDTSCDEIVGAY